MKDLYRIELKSKREFIDDIEIQVGLLSNNGLIKYPQLDINDWKIKAIHQAVGVKSVDGKDIFYDSDIVEFPLEIDGNIEYVRGWFTWDDEALRAEIEFEEWVDVKFKIIVLWYNPEEMKDFEIVGRK